MEKILPASPEVPHDTSLQKGITMSKAKQSPEVTEGEERAISWPEGLTPMPHQLEAVQWALSRKRSYLALDAGLGKTIVAAIVANKTKALVFYVCPPFLAQNTHREFDKWTFEKKLITIPDSMLAKKKVLNQIRKDFENAGEREKILIIDEAHRFKNEKAERSRALYLGILPLFKNCRVILMSGTPMPNSRPMELWPVMKYVAPRVFGLSSRFTYGLKYCGAYKDDYGYWNYDGFSNKTEFKIRIFKSFMLRRKKSLLKLPTKIEGLLTVGENLPPSISKIEKKILQHYTKEDLYADKIKFENDLGEDLHLATYLRLLGPHKIKHAVPFIEALMDETHENLLIFAVHKATISQLQWDLKKYSPLVITGDVPKEKRQDIVEAFQTRQDKRIFIGNIQACGVGFTLTKATRVIFVEFSWVEGDNTQASDRAHRIGQNNSVLVQYVVLKDSIDAARMEVLIRKRKNSI